MNRLVLFTTSIFSDESENDLQKLINSIDYQCDSYEVLHFILLQCFNKSPELKLGKNVVVLNSAEKISLSKARNLMLKKYVEEYQGSYNDVICFPDDDCSYHSRNQMLIMNFMITKDIDFFFCRYSESNNSNFEGALPFPPLSNVIKYSSSNTIFIKRDIMSDVFFDEKLGVGAEINGAEDLDYALRAFYASKKVFYSDKSLVNHRNSNPIFKVRYYPGSLLVLKKYRLNGFAWYFQYLRKLGIGLYYVVTAKIKPIEFLKLTLKNL